MRDDIFTYVIYINTPWAKYDLFIYFLGGKGQVSHEYQLTMTLSSWSMTKHLQKY